MKGRHILALMLLTLVAVGCKSEKRIAHYEAIYQQQPGTIFIAQLADHTLRRAVRQADDSAFNASLNTAAIHLYLTAAPALTAHGYYTLSPLASAQIATAEQRTGKQLRTDSIADYASSLGVDAVLFIDILNWSTTANTWGVEVEYLLRSTRGMGDLMHVHVNATKILPTDFKGHPKPLKADIAFANRVGCDLQTAQRCRLVETLNQYVLRDLPSGSLARQHATERYTRPHPDHFNLRIHRDGSVELLTDDQL